MVMGSPKEGRLILKRLTNLVNPEQRVDVRVSSYTLRSATRHVWAAYVVSKGSPEPEPDSVPEHSRCVALSPVRGFDSVEEAWDAACDILNVRGE